MVGQSRRLGCENQCLRCENQGVWGVRIKMFLVGQSRCLGLDNQGVWDWTIKVFGGGTITF